MIWFYLPAHELDEHLLEGLDLVHGVGHAEQASVGLAHIVALLEDYPARSCKEKRTTNSLLNPLVTHFQIDFETSSGL